jgi:hypothetical protein
MVAGYADRAAAPERARRCAWGRPPSGQGIGAPSDPAVRDQAASARPGVPSGVLLSRFPAPLGSRTPPTGAVGITAAAPVTLRVRRAVAGDADLVPDDPRRDVRRPGDPSSTPDRVARPGYINEIDIWQVAQPFVELVLRNCAIGIVVEHRGGLGRIEVAGQIPELIATIGPLGRVVHWCLHRLSIVGCVCRAGGC